MHPGWRTIGIILAIVFFSIALAGIARGRFSDPETGVCDRRQNPIWFWLNVCGLTCMGAYLLGVSLGYFSANTGSAPW